MHFNMVQLLLLFSLDCDILESQRSQKPLLVGVCENCVFVCVCVYVVVVVGGGCGGGG